MNRARHKFPQTQISAIIKSAKTFISITGNTLEENREALLSSCIHGYLMTFCTPDIEKELALLKSEDVHCMMTSLLHTLSRICRLFYFMVTQ